MALGRRALLALLLLVPLVPTATSQPAGHVLYCSRECLPQQVNDDNVTNTPVNVILYAHIMDVLQRAPLNVVPPDPGHEKDVNQGFLTPTLKVREDLVYLDNNWFYMFLLPRFVQYGDETPNADGPLGYPVALAGDEAHLYWYLSPHAVPQSNSTATPLGGVGVMPLLHVYARIETGRHPFHGTLIAEGETSTAAIVGVPASDYAYEFMVPLKFKTQVIPPDDGFVVSVNWYQAQNGDEQFTQGDWRIRTGPRFAPRLILPIEDPMEVTDVQSLYRSGTHYLVTSVTPALGGYDIDPFSLNMTFRSGPSRLGAPSPVFFLYDPHKPQTVRIVWAVPGEPKDFRAGTYEFQMRVSNLWHTYESHSVVPLSVIEFLGAPKAHGAGTPAPGLALVAAAWVAAAMGRRR